MQSRIGKMRHGCRTSDGRAIISTLGDPGELNGATRGAHRADNLH